jgi:hypothetical protein
MSLVNLFKYNKELTTMTQNAKIKLEANKPASIRMAFGPQAELILERLDDDVVQVTLVARTSFGWEMLGRQMLSLEQLQDLPIPGAFQTESRDQKPSAGVNKKR